MRPTRGLTGCLLLSLVGMGLAGYLTFLHLGLLRGELLGGAACGTTGAFNCHAVTAGPWGSWLGMPLSLWGILGYVTVAALALLGRQSAEWAQHARTLIVALASVFLLVDAGLLAVMAVVIRFYCLVCLLTYAVNLLLLAMAARSLEAPLSSLPRHLGAALRSLVPSAQRPAAWLFWGLVLVGIAGTTGLHAATSFVSRGTPGSFRLQIREFVSKQPRVSLEVQGDPTLGQAGSPLQIVEFSDFLCPACQRASALNTIIFASHRKDAAFVFKHYPLDTGCNDTIGRMVHPGACQIAAASECAHQQGKFWPFHDRIFERGPSYPIGELETDAARTGLDVPRFRACLESGQGMEAVKRDIAEAAKAKVTSTPTYVINGVSVTGGLNPAMFEEFVAVLRENR